MMRPFRAMLAILVLGAAVGAAPQSQTPSQTQPPVFRSGVNLVTVDVLVLDKAGRPIPELKAEDFTVTVDGKPQAHRLGRIHVALRPVRHALRIARRSPISARKIA